MIYIYIRIRIYVYITLDQPDIVSTCIIVDIQLPMLSKDSEPIPGLAPRGRHS